MNSHFKAYFLWKNPVSKIINKIFFSHEILFPSFIENLCKALRLFLKVIVIFRNMIKTGNGLYTSQTYDTVSPNKHENSVTISN